VEKCGLKQRKDDTPKKKGEKVWACDVCGSLVFNPTKPVCSRVRWEEAQAQVDVDLILHPRNP
jgi:ABC-type ATPase with predicted acetyltransferase domain